MSSELPNKLNQIVGDTQSATFQNLWTEKEWEIEQSLKGREQGRTPQWVISLVFLSS